MKDSFETPVDGPEVEQQIRQGMLDQQRRNRIVGLGMCEGGGDLSMAIAAMDAGHDLRQGLPDD